MNGREQGVVTSGRDGRIAAIVVLFATGLGLSGVMRFYDLRLDNPPSWTGYATLVYVFVTVFAAVRLSRIGVPMNRLGFGAAGKPLSFLGLAAVGVGLIQLGGLFLDPVTERLFGEARDLSRFSDVAGSSSALIRLLVVSWTLAAFGEELAFRIVLMRGIAFALGDSRRAFGIALIAQAILFGVIHAYQGPAGIMGSAMNGLVFGGITLAARGSIWPAALAHGTNNTIGILALYLAG